MYRALSPGAVELRLPFHETVQLASEHGFNAIECDPLGVIERYSLSAAQDLFAQFGVLPCSFGLPVHVQTESPQFKESIVHLEAQAKAASSLGIHRCNTYIFSWSDTLPFPENYAAHKARLLECARILKDYDIALGLEFLGPETLYSGKPHKFINTLGGMLELCNDIGTGNMGILLDVYHAYCAGMDVCDCLGEFEDETQIIMVHINDALKGEPISKLPDTYRYLPGEGGGIDVKGFLTSLQRFGYLGPVVCEPFSDTLKQAADPQKILTLLADSFTKVWPE